MDDGQTDGAAAENEYGVGGLERRRIDGVPAYGEWFDECGNIEADVVREFVDGVLWNYDVLREATAPAYEVSAVYRVADKSTTHR